MATLHLTRGLPGSGKTTRAKAWVAQSPTRRARVNRDDMRQMLHGSRLGTTSQETQVTVACHAQVCALLAGGVDVVCDDTNLDGRSVAALREVAGKVGARVVVWDLRDVPLSVCVERDAARQGAARVGERVIRDMHNRHLARMRQPV